jgi:VCBS repeat-containing protein
MATGNNSFHGGGTDGNSEAARDRAGEGVQPDAAIVAQSGNGQAAVANGESSSQDSAGHHVIELGIDPSGQVHLPSGASIDQISVRGHDLVIQEPDGNVYVVKDGALHIPTFLIGDVAIPPVAMAAALEANGIDVAAGPNGSQFVVGAVQSSGGNFEVAPPPLGPTLPLSPLLPPTALQFGQLENHELYSNLREDHTPTIDSAPAAGGGGATVDEAGLPARGLEPAGSDEGSNSEASSGTIGFTSPDGVSEVTLGNHVLTTTSHSFAEETLSNGTRGQLTAWYEYNSATGAGQIHYTFTLTDNTAGDNTTAGFAVVVKDSDGDVSAPSTLTINIVDDAPHANADTDSVTEDTAQTADGNVLTGAGGGTADVQGADGASVTGVASGTLAPGASASGNVGSAVDGSHGSITIGTDGHYVYTLDNSDPAVQALSTGQTLTDTFSYTITDNDGDPSTTTVTITINGTNDVPTVTVPTAGGDGALVYEAGLPARAGEPAGSDASSDSETTQGSFSYTNGDGASTVTIDDQALVVGQTYLGDHGTLRIDSISGTTVNYTYTLTDNVDNDTQAASDSFAIKVADSDGNTADDAAATLTINIVDDAPHFGEVTDAFMSNEVGQMQGILEYASGADGGSPTISGITGLPDDWTTSDIGGSSINIFAPDGTQIFAVQLNLDGTYDVIQSAVRPGTPETIPLASLIPANSPMSSYDFGFVELTALHDDTGKTYEFNAYTDNNAPGGHAFGLGNPTFDKDDSFRMDFDSAISNFQLNIAKVSTPGFIDVTLSNGTESHTIQVEVKSGDEYIEITPQALEDHGLEPFDFTSATLTGVDGTAQHDISVSFTTLSYTESHPAGDVHFTVNVNGTDGDGDSANTSFDVTSVGGSTANDSFVGTTGNDVFHGGSGIDHFDGNGGALNIVDYTGSTEAISIHLSDDGHASVPIDIADTNAFDNPVAGGIGGGDAAGDTLIGISGLIGGDGNDILIGNSSDNYFAGGAGNDTLKGGDGADTLIGGAGNDVLDGGAGSDHMTGGAGADTFVVGSDSLSGGIQDFIADYSGLGAGGGGDGDAIDLTDLLSGLASDADPLAGGYVHLTQDGPNLNVQVDADGGGNSFHTVAVLENYDFNSGTESVKILYKDSNGTQLIDHNNHAVV